MEKKFSRRDFFKASAIGLAATAAASTATVAAAKPAYANTPPTTGPFVKHLDSLPYEIGPDYQRPKSSTLGWMRIFDPAEKPIKFVVEDMQFAEGNTKGIPDTGKDLPKIMAEKLGIMDRNANMNETGVIYLFAKHLTQMMQEKSHLAGYRQLELAMSTAGWSVEKDYAGLTAFGGSPGGTIGMHPVNRYTLEMEDEQVFVQGMFNGDNYVARMRQAQGQIYQFESPDEAAKCIKRASRYFGACLAGVAEYDERWTYSDWATIKYEAFPRMDGRTAYQFFNTQKFAENMEVEVFGHSIVKPDWQKYAGFQPTHVLIFAVEMDYEVLATSPSALENAMVGKGYSDMAEVAYKIAVLLRELGYNAASSGNGDGLSVPYAAAAGLGEMGRNSNIVTQRYGPRIRLAKVYTDLNMTPDKPVSFGVKEFCSLCKKCAETCPGQAISYIDKPRMLTPEECGISENPWHETWGLYSERCLSGKAYIAGCTNCVAVCSWNKLKMWNHDVAILATKIPLLKDAARKFDEWFGYNGPVDNAERTSGFTTQRAEDFWNNPEPIQPT
ncbi:MAG: reductive dehalogenase [Coriobacteriia bacterium]|nr:reductive dehalogenase [Coriobacteriia bacterium]MCL2749981.1 reductive dehalogenase [Coriobacteriia bacterium]